MNLKNHLFIIGAIGSLNIKKDSSLLLAKALQDRGESVWVIEEREFYITPGHKEPKLFASNFSATKYENQFYLESFNLDPAKEIELNSNWTIHMRSDPPVDQRYMRYLWMLDYLVSLGIRVTNNPRAIMISNEKLIPYAFNVENVPSYYGEDGDGLERFINELDGDVDAIVVKPIDSFSGIGVEKISLVDFTMKEVRAKIAARAEAIIVQPFLKEVLSGEQRSIYLGAKLIGAITKYPPEGSFLANIAQGAKFEEVEIEGKVQKDCELLSKELLELGIDFVAFDILADKITEVNVTCPGLVNEVSTATGRDLADLYAEYFSR